LEKGSCEKIEWGEAKASFVAPSPGIPRFLKFPLFEFFTSSGGNRGICFQIPLRNPPCPPFPKGGNIIYTQALNETIADARVDNFALHLLASADHKAKQSIPAVFPKNLKT
jgi:hypothetical protein